MADPHLSATPAFMHALYCQRASARLGSVRKGEGHNTSYVMPTEQALTHDYHLIEKAKVDDSTVYGLVGSDNHVVSTFDENPKNKWYLSSLLSLNFSSARAPIRASFLIPETIALKNKERSEKEIAILFHEPTAEERSPILKRKNFSQAALMVSKREADFDADLRQKMLDEIQFQLINQVVKRVEPADSKIRLVFSGEGLAGLDAQLSLYFFLEDLVADLERPDYAKKYRDLKVAHLEIELSLIDSAHPNDLSAKVMPLIQKIKADYPNTKFKAYSIDTGQAKGKLGREHLFAKVTDPEQVEVHYEMRKGSDASLLRVDNNSNHESLSALRNGFLTRLIHSSTAYRALYFVATGIRNLFISVFVPSAANKDVLEDIIDAREKTIKHDVEEIYEKFEPVRGEHKKDKIISELKPYERDHVAFSKLVLDLDEKNRLQMFKSVPPIENLVFEGGGVKGLVYAGALKRLQEENLYDNVKRVAGSSAGAIVSALLAVGYAPNEIENKMTEIDFTAIMDPKNKLFWNPPGVRHIQDAINLASSKGVYQGKAFLSLLEDLLTTEIDRKLTHQKRIELIEAELGDAFKQNASEGEQAYRARLDQELDAFSKNSDFNQEVTRNVSDYLRSIGVRNLDDITFGQLAKLREDYPELGFKELFVTATKLRTGELVVFSHETHPNLRIKDAVRSSMSFPGAFVPYVIDGEEYVDGGVANNWPMIIFDKSKYLPAGYSFSAEGTNPATLGFLVDSEAEIRRRWCSFDQQKLEKASLVGFLGQVVNGLHSRFEELQQKYQVQAIQIFDENVPTLDFKLSPHTQKRLIDSGYREMDQYVRHYRHPEVHYEGLFFSDIREKYHTAQLTYEQINMIIENELKPYLEKLNEFDKRYTDQLEIHQQTGLALKQTRQALLEHGQKPEQLSFIDEQIKQLEWEIDTCEDALSLINEKISFMIHEMDEAEKALALISKGVSESHQDLGSIKENKLEYQRRVPQKASAPSTVSPQETREQLGIRISKGLQNQADWTHLKAFFESKSDVIDELQAAEDTLKFKLKYDKSQKAVDTAVTRKDDQLGYYLEEVPADETAQRKAFVALFQLSLAELIETSQDKEIDIDLTGRPETQAVMKSVLEGLIQVRHGDCTAKNLTFNIRLAYPKSGFRQDAGA